MMRFMRYVKKEIGYYIEQKEKPPKLTPCGNYQQE